MKPIDYKVDGMVLTTWVAADSGEKRKSYVVYGKPIKILHSLQKVNMFLPNSLISTNLIPVHPSKVNSRHRDLRWQRSR